MINIPCGTYKISANSLNYHPRFIKDVKVASDSVSIIKFPMIHATLQVIPHELIWEASDSTILNFKEFIHTGDIFNFKCK